MNDFTSPAVLAMNLIRYIGDAVSKLGVPIRDLRIIDQVLEGADSKLLSELFKDLKKKSLIKGNMIANSTGVLILGANLSLDGWEMYESEKRGSF